MVLPWMVKRGREPDGEVIQCDAQVDGGGRLGFCFLIFDFCIWMIISGSVNSFVYESGLAPRLKRAGFILFWAYAGADSSTGNAMLRAAANWPA